MTTTNTEFSWLKFRNDYSDYLHSDKWKALRKKVFERCGGLCEGCRVLKPDQVHHLTYDNFGDEFLWELVAVCSLCHQRLHPNKPIHFETENTMNELLHRNDTNTKPTT